MLATLPAYIVLVLGMNMSIISIWYFYVILVYENDGIVDEFTFCIGGNTIFKVAMDLIVTMVTIYMLLFFPKWFWTLNFFQVVH